MGDMYAVDLALDLRPSVLGAVLDDLRWHLGLTGGGAGGDGDGDFEDEADGPEGAMGDAYPLLAERGPAWRIGGVLVGELSPTAGGWSLTVRQEVHAELLPELETLVERLARHSPTEGVIGQIRFYEEYVPELLLNRAGTLVRMALASCG
ncbi:hypothetical protein [Streptomyces sp. ISL-86]|uniref:hypothetical protein n=1 Tax=Streptomyces sp. ISL-86 TaxID=2819187 RepID=UPI001BE6A0B3|nr:hypothetical protein [Streptomyces sp. ISL-86]MBT2458907.1 hypothetical protein [Streptomyces sp. ISL-86]